MTKSNSKPRPVNGSSTTGEVSGKVEEITLLKDK